MQLFHRHIKHYLLLALLSLGLPSFAQVVDTVCPSAPYGGYGVAGQAGSAYFWSVTGGQITHSNGKDSIEVNWDFAASSLRLSVVEVNASGCVGDTIYGEVLKGLDPVVYILGNDSICVGNTSLLSASGAIDYYWSTGEQSNQISPVIFTDTSFMLIGTDGCGIDTAQISVTALANPVAEFNISPNVLVENKEAIFTYNGQGASDFQWYIDNSLIDYGHDFVRHVFDQSGEYYISLYVENEHQCYDTSLVKVRVQKSLTNSFTPNDDGVNDVWEIDELQNYANCRVWIFDRNGGEVFYSQGYTIPWDGKRDGNNLPEGTYYYVIDLGSGNQNMKGTINILR